MSREKEPKNSFARKIQKLTTRARSASNLNFPSLPPSPVDYFSIHDSGSKSQGSRSRSSSQRERQPLTPITPTGLPGGASPGDVTSIASAPEELRGGAYASQRHSKQASVSSAHSNTHTLTSDSGPQTDDNDEEIADEMAQKILHKVSTESHQGWTI